MGEHDKTIKDEAYTHEDLTKDVSIWQVLEPVIDFNLLIDWNKKRCNHSPETKTSGKG